MPLVPKTKSPFRGKSHAGGFYVLDVDGDPHYVPAHQIRDIQNYDAEWGKGTTAITLNDSSSQRSIFYIYKDLEEVVALYKQSMAGEEFNLRDCSGPTLSEEARKRLQWPTKKDDQDLHLEDNEVEDGSFFISGKDANEVLSLLLKRQYNKKL